MEIEERIKVVEVVALGMDPPVIAALCVSLWFIRPASSGSMK